jgi:glucose/arabinose dehydrogenase
LGIAGRNYGWPYREGTFLFDPEANVELVYPIESEDDSYTDPVVQYDHDEGSAVSGGFVYAGEKIPKLKGKYVFGDMSLGTLFYTNVDELIDGQLAPLYRLQVEMNGEVSDMVSITGNNRVDLRIGEDHEGELYLMTKEGGGVYKVIDCKEVAL